MATKKTTKKTATPKVTKIPEGVKGKSKKKAPATKITAKKGNGVIGKATHEGGKVITLLVKDNPKRGKSTARYDLYKSGMTINAYVAAGGYRADIAWDLHRDFISVK